MRPGSAVYFRGAYDVSITDSVTGAAVTPYPNYHDRWNGYDVPLGQRGMEKGMSAFGAIRLDRLVPITRAGTYMVRVVLHGMSIWSQAGHVQLNSATLASNAIAITVLPPRRQAPLRDGVREGDVGTMPTGTAVEGFALSLKADRLFDPAPDAVVELRNVSGRPRQATFGPLPAYQFSVKDLRTGRTVASAAAPLRSLRPEAWDGRPLYPDSSLYALFDLQRMLHLTVDRYRVVVTGHPTIDGGVVKLVSNVLDLTVPYRKPWISLKQRGGFRSARLLRCCRGASGDRNRQLLRFRW
jgi:hypothetical protein